MIRPRWSPCPHCMAPSCVQLQLECTGQACRWYNERAYQAWLADGTPWVWTGTAADEADGIVTVYGAGMP